MPFVLVSRMPLDCSFPPRSPSGECLRAQARAVPCLPSTAFPTPQPGSMPWEPSPPSSRPTRVGVPGKFACQESLLRTKSSSESRGLRPPLCSLTGMVLNSLSSSVRIRSLNGTLGRFSNFLVSFDYGKAQSIFHFHLGPFKLFPSSALNRLQLQDLKE